MLTPTHIDQSAPFWPWFWMFLVIVYGILACVGDSITTMIGLGANKGFIEGNPIARWMFKEVGQAGAAFISTTAYIFISLIIGTHAYWPGMAFAGAIGVSETYFVIHNYLLLKKLGIPVK